ncbi:unnamed protein product [Mytilus coruscus]|uniref:Uncharacterized protein n=1 Tax=Mytilus coruscus TaxID=42192 RepID=A0A6J8C557_MYTCO|nr:unnamed protein product [Mytilus coruscus]
MATSSSYANATSNGEHYNKSGNEINHEQHLSTIKPVFLLGSDIFGNVRNRENFLTHEEVYKGIALVVPGNTLQGLQRTNGMWRIYVDSEEYRITLLTGIVEEFSQKDDNSQTDKNEQNDTQFVFSKVKKPTNNTTKEVDESDENQTDDENNAPKSQSIMQQPPRRRHVKAANKTYIQKSRNNPTGQSDKTKSNGNSETKPTKKGTLDQFLDPQATKTPKQSSDKRKPSTPTDTAHQREIHATRPRTGT